MSRVVIICKRKNHDVPLVDFLEWFDPLEKICLAINDELVPGRRLFLNGFAVTEPAPPKDDSREIRAGQDWTDTPLFSCLKTIL